MPIVDVHTESMVCDCCGISVSPNHYLSLNISTQRVVFGSMTQEGVQELTFCIENDCAGHVKPIAGYMVYEAAVHHAAVASAAGTPTNATLHPAIEITLSDDKGNVFANASSPM